MVRIPKTLADAESTPGNGQWNHPHHSPPSMGFALPESQGKAIALLPRNLPLPKML